MAISTDLDEQLLFRGDERDLLELLGNVIDNAFKYGRSRVRVSSSREGLGARGVRLEIEDDGDGIPREKQDFVLQRGARADTLVQGQGIGLAVVTDILKSYGGEIQVQESELGGAKIIIILNAVA